MDLSLYFSEKELSLIDAGLNALLSKECVSSECEKIEQLIEKIYNAS